MRRQLRMICAALTLFMAQDVLGDDGVTTTIGTSDAKAFVSRVMPTGSLTARYERVYEASPSDEMKAALKKEIESNGLRAKIPVEVTKKFQTIFSFAGQGMSWDESLQDRTDGDSSPERIRTVILGDRGEKLIVYGKPRGTFGKITQSEEPPLLDFTAVALALRLPEDNDPLTPERFDKASAIEVEGRWKSFQTSFQSGTATLNFSSERPNSLERVRIDWADHDFLIVDFSEFQIVNGRRLPFKIVAERYLGLPAHRFYRVTQTIKDWQVGLPKTANEMRTLWPYGTSVFDSRIGVEIPVRSKEGVVLTDEAIAAAVAQRSQDGEKMELEAARRIAEVKTRAK